MSGLHDEIAHEAFLQFNTQTKEDQCELCQCLLDDQDMHYTMCNTCYQLLSPPASTTFLSRSTSRLTGMTTIKTISSKR